MQRRCWVTRCGSKVGRAVTRSGEGEEQRRGERRPVRRAGPCLSEGSVIDPGSGEGREKMDWASRVAFR
jgi:hypothetical protein